MALVRWTPGGRNVALTPVRNDTECYEEDEGWRYLTPWSPGWTAQATPAYNPRIDLVNLEKEIVVKADLPGLDREDIDLTITNERLTLKGERRDEALQKNECFYCRESSFGAFERVIELPEKVLADEATATLKNGVLTLRLPKVAPPTPIKIEVGH